MKRIFRFIKITILVLVSLCLLLAAVSMLNNLSLPQHSEVIDRLSEPDKIRLAELSHLHQTLGEAVWPGFGQADIPIILYNEQYAFLIGYPTPPAGWVKVPSGIQRGGPWEMVPNEPLLGEPYYRQRLSSENTTPEAFTVKVGDHWAASMQTRDWLKISLRQPIQEDLPPVLRPVFPYQIFIGQLVENSDQYISLVAHEAFHAFEGIKASEKFSAAEEANRTYENQYPWTDQKMQADWQTELDLLARALRTTQPDEILSFAQQFLDVRRTRRQDADLRTEFVMYEKQREWIEGLARYAELEIWRQAAFDSYHPLADTARLADFNQYHGFEKHWSRELQQMTKMASDHGDGRFYYSGMAQAFLLDRLMPDWKIRAFAENTWLEDLLSEAVSNQATAPRP